MTFNWNCITVAHDLKCLIVKRGTTVTIFLFYLQSRTTIFRGVVIASCNTGILFFIFVLFACIHVLFGFLCRFYFHLLKFNLVSNTNAHTFL
jgi:hypothetical protein